MTKQSVTIEEIAGRKCTVIWHDPDKRPVCNSWMPTQNGYELFLFAGGELTSLHIGTDHIATALYALPRNPKPKHAALLYRYASEGLLVEGEYIPHDECGDNYPDLWDMDDSIREILPRKYVVITHACNSDGKRVGVAIDD